MMERSDILSFLLSKGVIIMAYEPTIWKDGDVISAEKLNKIENAIGNVLFININTSPLSVTWQDIYDAC